MLRTQRTGLLLILISASGYSFFAIFTKSLFDHGLTDPLDILIWRFILAAPLIWGVIGLSRRGKSLDTSRPVKPLPRRALIGMGILFGVVAGGAFFALALVPVSLYTVLIYTYPAIVALGATLFGERLSARGWTALGLTMLGIILTVPNVFSGFTGVDPVGVALTIFNAVTYAAYILLSSRILRGHSDLMQASALSISGSLLFVLGVTALRGLNFPANRETWASLIGLATISTVIPALAFYAGMSRIGAARAAIASTLEPVLTLIWAGLLLGERLQPIQVIGAALIIASIILLQLRRETSPASLQTADASPAQG